MAEGKHALRRHVTVGQDAEQRGHEDGDETLHGIEKSDVFAHARRPEVTRHGGEVCAPDCELQEVHDDQAMFQVHSKRWIDG